MEYISTRNTQKTFSFRDVFLKGLAPDGGLFVPKKFPIFTVEEIENLKFLSYKDLAVKIIYKFCSDQFNENEISKLVKISYKNFRAEEVVKIKKLGKLNLLEFNQKGSSLKVLDICSGEAEVYLTTTNKIKQWDTCASHCLISESGGKITSMYGEDLEFNTELINHENGLLVTNGLIHNKIVKKYSEFLNSQSQSK